MSFYLSQSFSYSLSLAIYLGIFFTELTKICRFLVWCFDSKKTAWAKIKKNTLPSILHMKCEKTWQKRWGKKIMWHFHSSSLSVGVCVCVCVHGWACECKHMWVSVPAHQLVSSIISHKPFFHQKSCLLDWLQKMMKLEIVCCYIGSNNWRPATLKMSTMTTKSTTTTWSTSSATTAATTAMSTRQKTSKTSFDTRRTKPGATHPSVRVQSTRQQPV